MEYEAAGLSGQMDEAAIRAKVNERFHEAARGFCYATMMLPFGTWPTDVMKDEVAKLSKAEYKDLWD